MQVIKGDLTLSTEQVIMHGCNCSGGFGSGVAGAIARRYPEIRQAYLDYAPKILGTCQFIKHNGQIWVNAFTQQSYGYDGRPYADLMAIGQCLDEVDEFMKTNQLTSIAMPKIGCGLGGLDWNQVSILVEELLKDQDVYVYEL